MARRCKNCGAKLPNKSDICKKCGEQYMDDFSDLDPQTQEMLNVQKPSNVFYVCLIIISVFIFLFALLLIFLNVTGNKEKYSSSDSADETSISSEVSEPDESSLSESSYYALDFIGKPFSEVKSTLTGDYKIIMGDTIQYSYADFPLLIFSSDSAPNDNSIIAKIIVTDNGVISKDLSADMSYEKIALALGVTDVSPVINPEDGKTFILEKMLSDDVKATFVFDSNSSDAVPSQVILQNDELLANTAKGTVVGIDSDSYLTLRSNPNPESSDINHLSNEDRVDILGEETDDNGITWYKVRFAGKEGYVNSDYIVKDNEIADDQIDSDIYFNADDYSDDTTTSESDDDSDDSDVSENSDDE